MMFIDTITKEKHDLPVNGEDKEKRLRCPLCAENSKRRNPKDLSIRGDAGLCHKCNAAFYRYIERSEEKEYVKPKWHNKTELSNDLVKWFEDRKISQNTLKAMRVTEGKEWMPQIGKEINTVHFNYFQDNELVNIKYRDGAKNFKMFKDGKLIFYNLDAIKDSEICVITEGEIDALSFHEALVYPVVSVPNGANKGKQNLEYLDNCVEYFSNKETIYLATDNDTAGVALRNELLRRLGSARCRKVSFDDCKDANEYLVKYGKEKLRERIDLAEEFPIEGVFQVKDFRDDFNYFYHNGMTEGVRIMHDNLNDLVTWETGRVAVVTGIPGMGKSEVVDEVAIQLNLCEGWKVAYFSPENFPLSYHGAKIAEKVIGKKFHRDGMNEHERDVAADYINENYFFISPEDEDYTLDNILSRAQDLIYRYGIRILVIDPWNRIEHQMEKGQNESSYVGRMLTKMTNFAQRNDVLLFLVAHPRKMGKDKKGFYEVPSLYDISGSANFFNQCDYGICMHQQNKGDRDFEYIAVYVQKVKFKFLGSIGKATFKYNRVNGRFSPVEFDEHEMPTIYTHSYNNYLIKEVEQTDYTEALKPTDVIPF